MLGYPIIGKLSAFYRLCLFCLSIYCLKKKTSRIDRFIIAFIIVLLLSSFFSEGFSELFYNAIRSQIVMMFFFFIGESSFCVDDQLMQRSIIPIILVGICGMILYIYAPSWYIQWKMEAAEVTNQGAMLEMLRLSAFWEWPYWISYGCSIIYCYILAESYRFECFSLRLFAILLFLLMIMILAQQRAPLFFSVFMTLFFIGFGLKKKRTDLRFKIYILIYLGLLISGLVLLFSVIDVDTLERLYMKAEETSDGVTFLENRADIFSEFYSKPISLFGEGLGYYSLIDIDDGRLVITDHQYMKILYENGVIGLAGYVFIFVASLMVGLRNYRQYLFEVSIVIMYLIAMSGANCLMFEGEHPAIFWFCCGRLFNKQCLKYKKSGINPLNCYL